jgi:DNA-binding CsgD family transcriptional regulator
MGWINTFAVLDHQGEGARAQCLHQLDQRGTGHSLSEIGAQLKLASNTVSTYRARIVEKTGTKNDVELALYAQRHHRGTSER